MTKQQFNEVVKKEGVYQAALHANIAGVSLAVVQLWIKSI